MKLTRRARLSFVAGGLAALLVGAALALPLIVDVNKYRGLIQSKATEALGRKVTLGPMSLSLLPTFGIRADDVEVENLLRARTLTVGVRLAPLLLGGSVDVRKVVLERPDVTATRDRSGRWSFEGIGETAGTEGAAGGAPPGRGFSLSRLIVTGGTVHLRDETRRTGGPLVLDVGFDLDASVKGSGAGDLAAVFDGTVAADRLLLALRGRFDRAVPPGAATFDLMVDRAEIDVARARELFVALQQPWPLPEGLLRSRSLKAGGRAQGSLSGGAPGSLTLTDLTVMGADLLLSRDRRGKWNFDALAPAAAPPGGGAGAPGPAVTIRNLRVSDARVTLHDEAAGDTPADVTLVDLMLVVEELKRDRPLSAQLEAALAGKGGTIALAGKVPMGTSGPIDVKADLTDLDVKPVAPYLKGLTGLSAAAGTVTAHIKMMGSYPQQVTARGALSLDDVKTAAGAIAATAEFDVTAKDALAKLQIGRFDLKFRHSSIGLAGSVDRGGTATLVDLELPPASIDADDLMSLAALVGVKTPVEVSSRQPIRLQARVKGDVTHRRNLDLAGSLEVADLSFRAPNMSRPVEQVKGRVTLRGDGFDVSGFSGVVGKSDVSGTMSVSDLEAPRASFTLASRRADFWELMSFLKEEPASTAPPASGSRAGGDLLSRLTARGTLTIGEGSFDTLAFSDLSATLGLEGKTIRLDPIRMKLYGGSMSGSAVMDVSSTPAVYTVDAQADGIDTDALLAANLQLKGMLAGSLSGRFSLNCSGATRDAALRNARGGGTVRIEKGRVGAVNVLKVLSRASDLMGEKSLKEVSGRLASEGTDFSALTATLQVGDGKIRSSDLSMTSPDLELKDDGTLDLLAGTIDVNGEIVFSDALSQAMVQERSKAVDYFWDTKRGRVDLPLRMSGPIASPMPNIDWGSAGGKLARRKVQESVRERLADAGLGGLLGDRGGKLPGDEAAPRAPKEAPASPPAPGTLSIAVEEKGFSGNPLLPDLKVRGTLNGTSIASASVTVTDGNGRVVHQQSLMEKVNKFYASHDRLVPAAINFKVEVDGRRLIGAGGQITVTIEITDAGGASAAKTVRVSR